MFPFLSKRGMASLQRRQAAQVKKTLKAATRTTQAALRQADKTAKNIARDVAQDAAREIGRTVAQASRPAPKPVLTQADIGRAERLNPGEGRGQVAKRSWLRITIANDNLRN